MRSKWLSILTLILWVPIIVSCSDEPAEIVPDPDEDEMKVVDNTEDDVSLPLAPNFTLASTEFEEVSLSDYEGKVVLLDFWATWCKPCEEEMPIFIELYDQYRERGFEVLGVSLDDEGLAVVNPFIEKLGVNYTILLADPEIVEKYKLLAIPSAYLINRNRRIVQVFEGEQGDKAIYEKVLQEIL